LLVVGDAGIGNRRVVLIPVGIVEAREASGLVQEFCREL
jgi:hypothetical protein